MKSIKLFKNEVLTTFVNYFLAHSYESQYWIKVLIILCFISITTSQQKIFSQFQDFLSLQFRLSRISLPLHNFVMLFFCRLVYFSSRWESVAVGIAVDFFYLKSLLTNWIKVKGFNCEIVLKQSDFRESSVEGKNQLTLLSNVRFVYLCI